MRRLLLPEEWDIVAPHVAGEFRNSMPATPEQGSFLAEMDGDRLAGFVHVETLFHFAGTWVAPEYRRSRLGLSLLLDAALRIPEGFSGVLMTERRNAMRTARLFGAREVGQFHVYRRDA